MRLTVPWGVGRQAALAVVIFGVSLAVVALGAGVANGGFGPTYRSTVVLGAALTAVGALASLVVERFR